MHTTHRHRLPMLATAAALALAASVSAQVLLPADHVDLGVGFHDDELELHWHLEDEGIEYEPGEAYAFIPLSSSIIRAAGSEWDFTGTTAGSTIYVAPNTDQTPSVLFLGLGTEEIAAGTLVGNSLTFALDSVSGPGEFALWQTDSFGQPNAFLGSASGPASFDLTTGGHDHFVWGFTAPGIYQLTFTASGVLGDGSLTPVSDTATFTFAVGTPIPEPSSAAALAGLGMLGLALTRRRRRA